MKNPYLIIYIVATSLPYISSLLNINIIHKLTPSEIRASILSLGSAISSIMLGINYLLIGFTLDIFGLRSTILTLGIINVASILLYFLIYKNNIEEISNGKV